MFKSSFYLFNNSLRVPSVLCRAKTENILYPLMLFNSCEDVFFGNNDFHMMDLDEHEGIINLIPLMQWFDDVS